MPTTTANPTAEAFNQTVEKTAEAMTATYGNLLGAYNAWLERDQEVRSFVTQSFLETFETSLERNREAAKQAQSYATKVADLQREWFSDVSGQVREYQARAFEQYRTSLDQAYSAWTDISKRQLNAFAGQVKRMSGDVDQVTARAREESEAALTTASKNVDRGIEAVQATASSAETNSKKAANAS